MSTVTAGAKLCVSCGKDVTNAQRMKDSQGQYWCLPCGEADRKMRKLGFGQHSTASGSNKDDAGDAEKRKKKKMLMLVAVLIVAAIVINFFVL